MVAAPPDPSEVRFGTSVTILRDDGREQAFRIVGEDEAILPMARYPMSRHSRERCSANVSAMSLQPVPVKPRSSASSDRFSGSPCSGRKSSIRSRRMAGASSCAASYGERPIPNMRQRNEMLWSES